MQVLAPTPGNATSTTQRDVGGAFSFEGRTVALVKNGWPFLDVMYDHMERRLRDELGVADVVHADIPISNRAPEETYDAIAERAGYAIVGCAT
jgi:hypothetical protein